MEKSKKLIFHRGQGLIEVLVSVGIVMLILGGVVPLMLISLASKTKAYERKAMVAAAEKKMEEVINEKQNNQSVFWPRIGTNIPSTDSNYNYVVDYAAHTADGCDDNCVDVSVTVTMQKDPTKTVTFSRFFAKN